MQIELSEKEIETISACLLAMILYVDQPDNDNAKSFKNDVGKIYGRMLKLRAEKDHKNEN